MSTPQRSPLSRRAFLSLSGTGALTVAAASSLGAPAAFAEIPVPGVLQGRAIPKFAESLVLPSTMPTSRTDRSTDYYDLSFRQFTQQILPAGMPRTTVWGYGSTSRAAKDFSNPSPTIRARRGRPVQVRWRNQLVDDQGNYLPHLFAVDPTLHWANPGREPGHGGLVSTDVRPDFTGKRYARPDAFTDPATQFTDYTGPVPIVPHLHGAKQVGDESDGYSEAWFLPDAKNIPAGFARHGRWFEFLGQKAAAGFGGQWGDGFVDYRYPNANHASTLWMHDHALGITRLNVYAGPTGFYLVEDDERPKVSIFPITPPHSELNLAIQDRAFHEDGSLFYPDTREYFDPDYTDGPWYPEQPGIPPVWVPEFFGNTIMVNGRTWPKHTVERRRYTTRLLNGCGSRTLYIDFTSIPGIKVSMVGGDQGYLRKPLDVMAQPGWRKGKLILAPAERCELIVDFREVPAGRHVLRNVGPDGFFGGGEPGVDFPPADPETTGNIMAFDVKWGYPFDFSTPPEFYAMPKRPTLAAPEKVRRLATTMHFHHITTDPRPTNPPFAASATMMGVIHGEPGGQVHIQELMWSDEVTENPAVGDTEDWYIYNIVQEVGIPHPIHVHEAPLEVVERGSFTYTYTDDYTRGTLTHTGQLPLLPGENGFKDTTYVYPGTYIRLRMKFDRAGQYMWHCHLLEHEDNEMMRPFRVGPAQPGQPPQLPASHIPHHGHADPEEVVEEVQQEEAAAEE